MSSVRTIYLCGHQRLDIYTATTWPSTLGKLVVTPGVPCWTRWSSAPVSASQDTEALQAARGGGPPFDVRPVPGGSSADGPTRLGEEAALSPLVDGAAVDVEPFGDLNGSHG